MVKLSALLRQFQSTHFATENCRQVCCFVGVVRVIRERPPLSVFSQMSTTGATTLLPSTKYITGC